MNTFIKSKIEKCKQRSILKYDIFKNMEIAESICGDNWQACGLLPFEIINVEKFCEWLKLNKPKSYRNGIENAANQGDILEKLDLDIFLTYVTGGNIIVFKPGIGSINLKACLLEDISSEYEFSSIGSGTIEDNRQKELITEYYLDDSEVKNYLDNFLKDILNDSCDENDDDEEDEEDIVV